MAATDPNTRRAWDDFYYFQPGPGQTPGETMYRDLRRWVETMLQAELNNGGLQTRRAGGDVIVNQFAVGKIGSQDIRTVPRPGRRGTGQRHCEEQLIEMIREQQDQFQIYTENFTCQMREDTERRCNCFSQVIQLARRYPESLVIIMYHQAYDYRNTANRGAGRQGRWEEIDLQNMNILLGNSLEGPLPQNLVFIKVDWIIQGNQVQVRGMQIAGINRPRNPVVFPDHAAGGH